jgi:hypothetical protein
MDFIIKPLVDALVAKGGIMGVVTAAVVGYLLFKENKMQQKSQADENKINELNAKLIANITEKTELLHKIIEEKEKAEQAQEERIEDLKEIIKEYNKTLMDVNFILENIKFVITNLNE